jgi:hypothetical protein
MKSMVCDYSSVQREIKAYKALSRSAKINKAPGKLYVRRALDHFELSQRPLGVQIARLGQFEQQDVVQSRATVAREGEAHRRQF